MTSNGIYAVDYVNVKFGFSQNILLAKALILLHLFRSINATANQRAQLTDNSEIKYANQRFKIQ